MNDSNTPYAMHNPEGESRAMAAAAEYLRDAVDKLRQVTGAASAGAATRTAATATAQAAVRDRVADGKPRSRGRGGKKSWVGRQVDKVRGIRAGERVAGVAKKVRDSRVGRSAAKVRDSRIGQSVSLKKVRESRIGRIGADLGKHGGKAILGTRIGRSASKLGTSVKKLFRGGKGPRNDGRTQQGQTGGGSSFARGAAGMVGGGIAGAAIGALVGGPVGARIGASVGSKLGGMAAKNSGGGGGGSATPGAGGSTVGGVIEAGKALYEFTKNLRESARAALEANRKYEEMSAGMSLVFAQLNQRQLLRDMESGNRLSGSTKDLADSEDFARRNSQELEILGGRVQNYLGTAKNYIAGAITAGFNEVAGGLNTLIDQGKKQDRPATFGDLVVSGAKQSEEEEKAAKKALDNARKKPKG